MIFLTNLINNKHNKINLTIKNSKKSSKLIKILKEKNLLYASFLILQFISKKLLNLISFYIFDI